MGDKMQKYMIVIAFALLLPLGLLAFPPLPECYHSYAEITDLLFNLEDTYPDIAKVHLIGYSQQENLPIYAMQISADVEGQWERPALLFVGQVHAEEVLGVEITLSNIQKILEYRDQFPYSMYISQLDSWWIPTLNPEGHNVVTSNIDVAYRKNKRDNNNNGIFDFLDIEAGGDIDGVDINRNFDFNWVHGDTLYQPPTTASPEAHDYYRGPSPMSESEIQAIKNLADQKNFVYSICWHSSRSGNFAEKVYYSFNWKDVRPSPDLAFAQSIAQGVANQIMTDTGNPYEYYPNASRRGAFHDWMYKQYGTIQLLIEVGTLDLQPSEPGMLSIVQRASNGVWWLMNRALMYSTAVPSNSLLTGHTIDSSNSEPIQAEIIIQERHAPWFVPRLSNAQTGRFFKPLPMGGYTVIARKKGYWDKVLPNTTVLNNSWTTINIPMDRKADAVMSGTVNTNGTGIPARIIIKDIQPDTLWVNGDYIYHGYEGEYEVEITADGYYPYLGTINLHAGTNHHYFNLSPVDVLFEEDWEENTAQWELVGENNPDDGISIWARVEGLSNSGYAITDSWGKRGNYLQNSNVWIKTVEPIFIPSNGSPLLTFESHLYTEWTHDPARVEASPDGETWTQLWIKSGRYDWWQNEYVNLEDYSGQHIYLRFRLQDSSTADELTDPGWTLDNIRIVTGSATANVDATDTPVVSAMLHQNFPNPFNPETTIAYDLASASAVSIEIYNIKGQLVRSYQPGSQPAGKHQIVFDGLDRNGNAVASGVYFYRLKTADKQLQRKMILMK